MRHIKGVFVGATAAVLLLASGCRSERDRDMENQRGTGGAGMNTNDSANDLRHDQIQSPDSTGSTGSTNGTMGADGRPVPMNNGQGTGGSGTIQDHGSDGLGTGATDSHQMGGTTGTGTEGSDMGSGGATHSGQDQEATPR
ncbi:MAG: hypothetical protein ABW123_11920 [Cystobacter sp.]